MASSNPLASLFPERPSASADPFAMQLALSRDHTRLVPMRRVQGGYEVHPDAEGWFELPAGRGFAGYGLGRALRMLLDVLRGLTALHDTFSIAGEPFAHGEVALPNFRVDAEGVCRLVPLTARHSAPGELEPSSAALGHVAPERLLGETIDARADVFSAGVLLWEALAGRRLFDETTADAIIDRLMGVKLQMPNLPPELAWAIPLKSVAARALAVDPYRRFSDCAELATAIAIVARERVASHAEIAIFFGAPARSSERRARDFERPVPSQSSTFSAVRAPSSRRASTLAPLGASSSRSRSPSPSQAVTPIATGNKSPFSVLLLPPISALPTTPAPALAPIVASTLSAVAVSLPELPEEELRAAITAFRPARWRRVWASVAVCALGATLALALHDGAVAPIARAPLAAAQPEPPAASIATSPDHAQRPLPTGASSAHSPTNNVSAPHAVDMHAAPHTPKSTKATGTNAKDYGI